VALNGRLDLGAVAVSLCFITSFSYECETCLGQMRRVRRQTPEYN